MDGWIQKSDSDLKRAAESFSRRSLYTQGRPLVAVRKNEGGALYTLKSEGSEGGLQLCSYSWKNNGNYSNLLTN